MRDCKWKSQTMDDVKQYQQYSLFFHINKKKHLHRSVYYAEFTNMRSVIRICCKLMKIWDHTKKRMPRASTGFRKKFLWQNLSIFSWVCSGFLWISHFITFGMINWSWMFFVFLMSPKVTRDVFHHYNNGKYLHSRYLKGTIFQWRLTREGSLKR